MSSNKKVKTEAGEDKQRFVDAHAGLVQEITDGIREQYPDFDGGAIEWFKHAMEYNCMGGKMNRGLSVIATYRIIVDRDITDAELKDLHVLGWAVEWLQAFFLVADDIMDGSITRRGQPCWYKQENVGMVAINDSFLIESAIYKILKKYFDKQPFYVRLLELLHETTYQTELGQMLDLITAPEDKVDLSKFSLAKYKNIVKYKTAFYSFYLPVAMAMMRAGITDQQPYDNALEILLEMGEFFQIQDDWLDCYGDPKHIGKIGTDIQDNKCGWLIIKALEICTPEQRVILESNYAKKDDECVQRVKQVYKDLDITKHFKAEGEKSYARLQKLIEEKAGDLPAAIFTTFADKIYKRDK